MIFTAFTFAVLASTGFFLLFQKLPANIRKYIVKYSLITDFVAMVGTYYLFGGTVTALMAGAMVDIIISAILHVLNHPSDFEWLFDVIKQVKAQWATVQVKLREFNDGWKAKKAALAA